MFSDFFQKRDIIRTRFVFVFYGTFNPYFWEEKINLKSATITEDSNGLKYAYIKTKGKRASEIESHFNKNDAETPDGYKVKLSNIDGYGRIISFVKGEDPMKHAIYKTMMKFITSASCIEWKSGDGELLHPQENKQLCTGDQYAGASSSSATTKIRRLLETDMIPSSFNPICPKQQRAMHTKNPNNGRLEGKNSFFMQINQSTAHIYFSGAASTCEEDNGPTQPSIQKQQNGSSDQGQGELNTLLDDRPLGDKEDQYALNPEGLVQPSDITDQLPVESPFEYDNSRDSTASPSSLSRAASSPSQSPGTKKMSKVFKKIFGPSIELLLKESKARDCLASGNERKDSEIEDHKHKRKSQEGKTAAQTRKANLAIQGETRALEELALSKTEIEREKNLREKAEAGTSTLLIANAGLCTAYANLTPVVCQQIDCWQLKNGYDHLKEFVSHLRYRNLTQYPNCRSLKGVAPALPFSDVAYRRYYDHALAYTDFKEASKSEDKHRMYLGLLGGGLYPETVLYHFRERMLDQVYDLCVVLNKSLPFKECEVGPLLSPVQGDPFNVDEVRCFLFWFRKSVIYLVAQMKAWKSGHTFNTEKMRSLQKHFAGTEPRVHWQYLVFLHRCNFNGRLEKEDTDTILKMLQGPMYNEAAFVAMETPLINLLISLRSELEGKHPAQYWQHNHHWGAVARQMQLDRDSSHRAVNPDEGRANEYFVFARSLQL